ncbi:hypothetical protein ABGV42_00810 [Paenibacillus pabuli]|uniref:hypothetical protein n=1 Tax=Paenibacillus pabuli TaxID=1472 RepID=UPI0032421422
MRKGIFKYVLVVVLIMQVMFVTSASADPAKVVLKPGETYEFVVTGQTSAYYHVGFTPTPATRGHSVDIVSYDKFGNIIEKFDKVSNGTGFLVYAEGRSSITNTGEGDYAINYPDNYVKGQKTGTALVDVEQNGSVDIEPGETYRVEYTAVDESHTIDVVINNPNGSEIIYSVYAKENTSSGSSDGYFPVAVPNMGSAEFTNKGDGVVNLQYYSHWIKVSKVEKSVELVAPDSKYTVTALTQGNTVNVENIGGIMTQFNVDSKGAAFKVTVYDTANTIVTDTREYPAGSDASVTLYEGNHAVVENIGNNDSSIVIRGLDRRIVLK